MSTKRDDAPSGTVELPVFLINLDRSPDRLHFMQAEAQRVGVAFERFSAVDGREALPDWLRPQFAADARLSSGEVGCYASHLSVHRRIVEGGLPYAMVLEDDVELHDDLLPVAEAALQIAPHEWDYIHLSGRVFKRALYAVAALPNGRHLVRHTLIPNNAGGYLISRQGAAKLLRPGPRVRPIDMEIKYAWIRDLDVFGIYPSPIRHGIDLATTIAGRQRHQDPRSKYRRMGMFSRCQGHIFCARKLGVAGYVACGWANIGLAVKRRLRQSGSAAIPVVVPGPGR